MIDAARRSWSPAPRIDHWVFESVPGQIRGCDDGGRVLVAIVTDPLFGPRLAAAFGSTSGERVPVETPTAGARFRPAFPF